MDQVPIRQLQQHASAVIRRVRDGETVGITDRGTLVAVIAPPSSVGGAAALIAAGRVRPGVGSIGLVGPPPVEGAPSTAEILEDLRRDVF